MCKGYGYGIGVNLRAHLRPRCKGIGIRGQGSSIRGRAREKLVWVGNWGQAVSLAYGCKEKGLGSTGCRDGIRVRE